MSDTPEPGTDKTKFIRTYAKDVALFAGGQGKAHAPQAAPEPVPTPSPAPAPSPAYTPPVSSDAIEREATLERLRRKVEQSVRDNPPPPIPPKPVFEEPIAPPPAPIPPVVRENDTLSPLHTYKSDFADQIDQKGASAFSVLAAQQDAKPAQAPAAKKKNVVLVSAAVALIVFGGVGLATAVWYVMRANTVPGGALSAPSLVFADEQIRLTSSGPDLMSELAALASSPLPEGNVLVVYLSESTTTSKGSVTEVPLAGGALISAMELPAPDILLRNISPESTVGIVHAGEETRPFFVFRVTSYERTFAGMLSWEVSMARDLALLYPARAAGSLSPSGTTAAIGTSTPAYVEPVRPLAAFADAIVANHDVRVLRDTKGQTLMLYGYAQKDLLVLARDEAAYAALIARLSGVR